MKKRKTKAEEKPEEKTGLSKYFQFRMTTTLWIILGTVVIFGIFVVYILSKGAPPATVDSYQEPLVPVVGLKLLPGETYVYEIGDGNKTLKVKHEVNGRTDGCMAVTTSFVGLQFENTSVPFCLDEKTGVARVVGQSPLQNASGAGPDFAQPWMLALKDGWTWKLGVNTSVETVGAVGGIEAEGVYEVAARGSIKGRDAFKVLVHTTVKSVSNGRIYDVSNKTETIWVDAEKRVLLYTSSGGIYVDLVEAPFAVERYSEPAG